MLIAPVAQLIEKVLVAHVISLGFTLVSWFAKKQNSVALSTVEAEYISTASCCAQVLWIRETLHDYGFHFHTLPLCVTTKVP